jgi:hypothetical protein
MQFNYPCQFLAKAKCMLLDLFIYMGKPCGVRLSRTHGAAVKLMQVSRRPCTATSFPPRMEPVPSDISFLVVLDVVVLWHERLPCILVIVSV